MRSARGASQSVRSNIQGKPYARQQRSQLIAGSSFTKSEADEDYLNAMTAKDIVSMKIVTLKPFPTAKEKDLMAVEAIETANAANPRHCKFNV